MERNATMILLIINHTVYDQSVEYIYIFSLSSLRLVKCLLLSYFA